MGIGSMDFLAMKQLETNIKRIARRASYPNVVPFPVFKRWKACKRKNGATVAKGGRETTLARIVEAPRRHGEGPEAA